MARIPIDIGTILVLTKNEVKDFTRQIIARYVEDILEMLASLSKAHALSGGKHVAV
jgi:hypothetical protein